MRYLLIPVKDLTRAKQRMAPLMTQEERTLLAEELMRNTLAAAARVRHAARIAVVTLYPPANDLAGSLGMQVIRELHQISESDSVDYGSREAMKDGATAVLRLPIDLPLISTEEIDFVLEQDREGPAVVMVPSRDGTGTNAILRRPPDLFPSHFGPNSLAKHIEEARNAGADCRILHLPRIGFDLDDPTDLAELFRQPEPSPIHSLLKNMGVETRLP